MARIFFETPDHRIIAETALPTGQEELVIGRGGDCTVLIDRPCISRRHLAVRQAADGGLQVCDQHSTLGTTIDGRRLVPFEWTDLALEQKLLLARQITMRIDPGQDAPEVAHKTDRTRIFPAFLVRTEKKVLECFREFAKDLPASQHPAVARLRSEITARVSELAAVVEVGLALANIEDYFRLLNFSLDMALKITKAHRGAIVLLNEQTQKMEIVTHRSISPNEIQTEMSTSKSVLLKSLKLNQALVIGNTESDPDFAHNRSIFLHNIKSVAVAPLRFERRTLGLLYLDSQGVVCPFPERIEEILEVLSSQIALAINNARLFHQATKDPLTGVNNRRAFLQRYREEFARALRHQQPISIALLDIDLFKNVNDTFGHDVGDAVLEAVARLMKENTRVYDYLARFGGEEFILLLTNTDAAGAVIVAEKIRSLIERTRFRAAGDKELTLTASIGLATVLPADLAGMTNPNHLIKQADLALYDAKSQGRNQVRAAAPTDPAAPPTPGPPPSQDPG